MARTAALIKASIWDVGSDFRGLTINAQRVYLLLLTQPQITNCGVLAYTPERWARMAAGDTLASIQQACDELADRDYIVVDIECRELLIRTFIKHDRIEQQPNLKQAAKREFHTIESDRIRQRLTSLYPDIFTPAGNTPEHADETHQGTPDRTPEGTPNGTPTATPSAGGSSRAGARDRATHARTTGTYTNTDTYTEVEEGSNAAAANPREPERTTAAAAAAGIDITPIIDQLQTWGVGRKLETSARQDPVRAKACIDRVLSEPNRRGAPGGFYRSLWEDGVIPEPGGGRPKRKPLIQVAASVVENKGPHMTWDQLLDEIHELERDRGEQLTSEQLDQLSRQHDHQTARAAA